MRKIILFLTILIPFSWNVKSQTYNAEAAADYAREWCNKRNPRYETYSKDCANFVSQCLIAGGLDLSAGTDGRGAYVKTDNVIAGAAQLVQHLDSFQTCTKTMVDQGTYYLDADLGDPCFLLNAS